MPQFRVSFLLLACAALPVYAQFVKTLNELTPDELSGLLNSSPTWKETSQHDDGCGTHVPGGRHKRSNAKTPTRLHERSAASFFDLDTVRCNHCPTDGICDNPMVRNAYSNRSEQLLNVSVTWHLLPNSNGSYDVSLADLNGARERLEIAFAGLGLNFTSKFRLYSTGEKPTCNETSPNSFSDLRTARVATSNHATSPHPYCFTPSDAFYLPHLYFHRLAITSDSYTILSYADPTALAVSADAIPYGAHQRKDDVLVYSIVSTSPDDIQMVLYRFPERQSFLLEKNPSSALSAVNLTQGINVEYTIPEDGDYFIWVYNRRTDGQSVIIQYLVNFFKHNCYSQDEFVSCFRDQVDPNSFNVVILPSDVFQTSYRRSGNLLLATSIDGFAYFPFGDTLPWQVGLSFVAVQAVTDPSWTVVQHELGHNMGLWHPSHGVSEMLQCQTQTDNEPCRGNEFRCVGQDKCIPVQFYCNGVPDCEVDNSDEPENCLPLCYGQCENNCSESNDFSDYIRDRVGDFCEDTPAAYTVGVPGCSRHAVTQLEHSENLMAIRRDTVTYLTAQQQARARCWLLNGVHNSFVSCRKEIKFQYDGYRDDCLSTFYETVNHTTPLFVECSADPCDYINPCKNGGTCVSNYDTVSCDCTGTGYCGHICQNLSGTVPECPLPTTPPPTPEPGCSSSTFGCCPDGVTVAGPYHTGCPGVDDDDVWEMAIAEYLSLFDQWKNGCS
jgi:hypothetical protein